MLLYVSLQFSSSLWIVCTEVGWLEMHIPTAETYFTFTVITKWEKINLRSQIISETAWLVMSAWSPLVYVMNACVWCVHGVMYVYSLMR